MHAFFWSQQQHREMVSSKNEKRIFSERAELTAVQQLVCFKSVEIADEFGNLLDEKNYSTTWSQLWPHVSDDKLNSVRAKSVLLVTEAHAD